MTEIQGLLVVSESPQVHDAVERLLVALETHCRRSAPSPDGQPQVVRVDPSPSAERIERILQQPISANYCGLPLNDVLRDLACRLELPIAFDQPALDIEGFDFREFVSTSAHQRPLVEVLDELLEPTQYEFDIRRDVLFFTFKARRNDEVLQTRLYRVDDLLPAGNADMLVIFGERLTSIDPPYWNASQGGPGAVIPVGADWLAVSAHSRQHQNVAAWLASQRSGQPLSPQKGEP